jgi:hypothetical protein
MRIHDTAADRKLAHLGLRLTEPEAMELRDALTGLINDPAERHEHISAANFQVDLTVWIDRENP